MEVVFSPEARNASFPKVSQNKDDRRWVLRHGEGLPPSKGAVELIF